MVRMPCDRYRVAGPALLWHDGASLRIAFRRRVNAACAGLLSQNLFPSSVLTWLQRVPANPHVLAGLLSTLMWQQVSIMQRALSAARSAVHSCTCSPWLVNIRLSSRSCRYRIGSAEFARFGCPAIRCAESAVDSCESGPVAGDDREIASCPKSNKLSVCTGHESASLPATWAPPPAVGPTEFR